MAAKQKYYVVWQGRTSGVFDSWEACKAQIDGYEGAQYKSFPTENAAKMAFAKNYWQVVGSHKTMSLSAFPDADERPLAGCLSVDAACSGNPGVMEYRGVLVDTGEEVFRQGPFAAATNNIGEFLAIVHALALVEQGKLTVAAIYSDSVTAQAWVRQRRCKSKLVQNADNAPVFELINRANAWLATHTVSTKVLKWKTDIWGEIPADFGRK
ncbi:MAG: viroplasmin family protein [Paludibacteraceae bacterium]